MPDIYIILGCQGSGRCKILNYLIQNGIADTSKVAIYVSSEEKSHLEQIIQPTHSIRLLPFSSSDNLLKIQDISESDLEYVFILTNGLKNPIDQLEQFKQWLDSKQWYVTRIISIVNCNLLYQYPPLIEWFKAIIYFSDYVLLNKRDLVPNKWMKDFMQIFKKECYPCVFEYVKKGESLDNVLAVLDSEIRRMSFLFDPDESIIFEAEDGMEMDDLDDSPSPSSIKQNHNLSSSDEPEGGFTLVEQVDELDEKIIASVEELKSFFSKPDPASSSLDCPLDSNTASKDDDDYSDAPDPYLERNHLGQRIIKIPDIQEFLVD